MMHLFFHNGYVFLNYFCSGKFIFYTILKMISFNFWQWGRGGYFVIKLTLDDKEAPLNLSAEKKRAHGSKTSDMRPGM